MKVSTEVQDSSRGIEKQKFEILNNIKDTPIYYDDFENDNSAVENESIEERKKKLKILKEKNIGSKLILEISNKETTESTRLNIDCVGLENSLRGEEDGITYFGCVNNDSEVRNILFK